MKVFNFIGLPFFARDIMDGGMTVWAHAPSCISVMRDIRLPAALEHIIAFIKKNLTPLRVVSDHERL